MRETIELAGVFIGVLGAYFTVVPVWTILIGVDRKNKIFSNRTLAFVGTGVIFTILAYLMEKYL